MLKLNSIKVGYGAIEVLHGASLEVNEGEIVALVGSNGAGKSTMLKTIQGILHPKEGTIYFLGERIDGMPAHKTVEHGIVLVPEGRMLFPGMTVLENLLLGSYKREARKHRKESIKQVVDLFPILEERMNQHADTLSGGEQQMLAVARGLMSRPKLLMLDELSLGLAPMVLDQIFAVLGRINKQGIALLLVEQNLDRVLAFANKAYLLENGEIALQGTGSELLNNAHIKEAYIGL